MGIEQQVLRANQYKENHHRTQQQVEAEVRRQGTFASLPRVYLAILFAVFLFLSCVLVWMKQTVPQTGFGLGTGKQGYVGHSSCPDPLYLSINS
jgi:cell division protein FtsL